MVNMKTTSARTTRINLGVLLRSNQGFESDVIGQVMSALLFVCGVGIINMTSPFSGKVIVVHETVVERDFRVMTYDVDFAGIMSNQVYQRWLEDLRMDLLSRFVDIRKIMSSGSVPVLARTEIDFKMPARLMDEVTGKMWVEELKGPRWALRTEFTINGKVCAKAYQYGVFVDTRSFRPVNKPDVLPDISPRD
jgi:acyl-CoA thioester hydrolase